MLKNNVLYISLLKIEFSFLNIWYLFVSLNMTEHTTFIQAVLDSKGEDLFFVESPNFVQLTSAFPLYTEHECYSDQAKEFEIYYNGIAFVIAVYKARTMKQRINCVQSVINCTQPCMEEIYRCYQSNNCAKFCEAVEKIFQLARGNATITPAKYLEMRKK